MRKLTGSIGEIVRVKGSIAYQTILSGSIKTMVTLKGSVATFTRSLSTRANIIMGWVLSVRAKVLRRIKNVFVSVKVSVVARAKVFKIAKGNMTVRTEMKARARVFRNISPTIGVDVVIGKSSLLNSIKDKTLNQIRNNTLKQITFAMGVLASIVRVTGNVPIIIQTEMTVDARVIRKRKLNDIKGMTLNDIKNMTLSDLVEYEV